MEAGDQLCLVCGADAVHQSADAAVNDDAPVQPSEVRHGEQGLAIETIIDGWRLVRRIDQEVEGAPFQTFVVEKDGEARQAMLVLYNQGAEPDPAVFEALRSTSGRHVPALVATGKYEGSTYEVSELISGVTLSAAGYIANGQPEVLRAIVAELADALANFSEWGLRHRDLHPGNVRIRSREPLDLVVTGFGSARLSDFDLESVAPLELTRYSAPEAIVGAVSAASDWWSLGMLVLEQVTAGRCFEGVNDQAFRLHVVTRGVSLPADLASDVRGLLRGLLARDPISRWSAPQVRAWLKGETVEAPDEQSTEGETAGEQSIALGGRSYSRASSFALAAADPTNWEEARDLVLRGAVVTWLEQANENSQVLSEVRRLSSDANLTEDFRHALALMAMNPSLPLTMKGEIVTPSWLMGRPQEGYAIISGEVVRHLERLNREDWLVRLGTRASAVRERALLLEITLEEERLRVALLASSRASLQAERDALRRVFPESDHAGLASILDRTQLTDEDLIILVSAAHDQYVPVQSLISAAQELASEVGMSLDTAELAGLLCRPRRELFELVDQRIANFARCQIARIDDWADAFRVERRMPLPRAVILLGVQKEHWKEPPKQQYVKTLLDHFEKRVSGTVSRGPLVRFLIGKTTPRVDLFELGTGLRTAEALLNHVLERNEAPIPLDPSAYSSNEQLETRLRRLVSHATTFRRDTGLDGRTLGFPFLLFGEAGAPAVSRPKLAPVLLWPVSLNLETGAGIRQATLAFDGDREEVRLNPALEGLLGPEKVARWRSARDELLGRGAIRIGDVIDAFGGLAAPRGRALGRLPGAATSPTRGTALELVPAATLFNAEFTGQSVAADLRNMGRRRVADTALDALIRVSDVAPGTIPTDLALQGESFAVVPSDPSQELALQASRSTPGLVVEGPPGTGKSQTIVNVVSDAIGRGEAVLVVCQKQAALQVVKKRLDAEGLSERLFMVVDVAKDRDAVIRALREQITQVRANGGASGLGRQRQEVVNRIADLEKELDQHHGALHDVDDLSGHTYRALLGLLVQTKAEGPVLDVPSLRSLVGTLDRQSFSSISEACAPLTNLWLAASFEDSPLHALNAFPADEGLASEILVRLQGYLSTEQGRGEALHVHADSFDTDAPVPLMSWLSAHRAMFLEMSDADRQRLASWLPLFQESTVVESEGVTAISSLSGSLKSLEELNSGTHADDLFPTIASLSDVALQGHLTDAEAAATSPRWFDLLNPYRWAKLRRTRHFLSLLGQPYSPSQATRLRDALILEKSLRPGRRKVEQTFELLGIERPKMAMTTDELKRNVRLALRNLEVARTAANAVHDCPRPQDARQMALKGTMEAFAALARAFEGAEARYLARQASLRALEALANWFPRDWMSAQARVVASTKTDLLPLKALLEALPALENFQRFRLRATTLPPKALEVFSVLRRVAAQLQQLPTDQLHETVRRTLHYAAYLSWKAGIETRHPALLLERSEIERKVVALGEADAKLREVNRQFLRSGLEPQRLATMTAWEEITRLRGPRARRLREIIDQGADLGLMHLRPIWLMNPDVASRVLPLKAAMFDLVVYDEASQMLVEHALPTLFRARRVLISGDEKQMPPSSFFSSRIDGDEDEDSEADELEDGITETERTARAEAWNRREVKDCPDLLQLGRGALPASLLQIHYRSRYRELIGFSNLAYYQGSLSVPVRHPDAEVRRAQPIEVVRVNGTYESQTNQAEAAAVVQLLARFWESDGATTPTIGVVTFNRKQADTIEDAIDQLVSSDAAFAQAYRREVDRIQNGEDMGFFVKNVENVQGDERDVIIFSTTFGRDKRGTFRRNFGVLSQTGGERRLNVAVTRARDKVILVTSIPVADVSDWLTSGRQARGPRDYLQAYLHYAEQVGAGALEAARLATRKLSALSPAASSARVLVEDGFTKSVQDYVRSLGYVPILATDNDAFGVDFAIENPRTGLFGIGIECDAPRHPLLRRARAREIWRPSVLKSAIGQVHRVSSHGWFHRSGDERTRLATAIQAALG